ncbi:hypothetical protein H3Z83_11630 [Tenacibaculum sp. S7007]|uniref:Adhesin domain-containing protein n=1 Tax=Tenacibaculum pelagium TaxID=2759527 RepID=A0A839ASS8_9FLAO|nr:hypothetical protein [Tenacibaculum pelagium]MBA6157164.1 hypothetical protein [Tenacibaculum pelagium]
MKKTLLIIFLCFCSLTFCQDKLIEQRDAFQNNIEIITDGLDNIVIENSEDDMIVVSLLDENPNTHSILFKEEDDVLRVQFQLNFKTPQNDVFRKYITKRLQKASAVIKVPKNKNIILYGKVIGVTSSNYKGDLSIFIDRGNIQLNKVIGNIYTSLFLGNVYAKLKNDSNVDIVTTKGEILVNKQQYKSRYFQKNDNKASLNFTVKSINGNVNLITE